jgi:hypothetical protein
MTRLTPYVAIHRAKCSRCKAPAEYEWSGVCAERKERTIVYHALCSACDREANEMLVKWFYGPEKAEQLMQNYERQE